MAHQVPKSFDTLHFKKPSYKKDEKQLIFIVITGRNNNAEPPAREGWVKTLALRCLLLRCRLTQVPFM